jgi:hypothetical protein
MYQAPHFVLGTAITPPAGRGAAARAARKCRAWNLQRPCGVLSLGNGAEVSQRGGEHSRLGWPCLLYVNSDA